MSRGRTTRPIAARRDSDAFRDRLLAQLRDGLAALTSSERWATWLRIQARFHRYSFNNALLIAMQRPDATRIAGYRAWQAMGRQVRAGERGIAIFAPVARRVPVDVEDDDAPADSGRVVQAFRLAYVFDISQTDGPPLPDVAARPQGSDPGHAVGRLDAVAAALGFRVDVTALRGVDGSCSSKEGVIRIDVNLSPAHRVVTEAHELAHALLHPNGYADTPRPQAELEAESVAYIVCQYLGLDSGEASFGYVAHWGGGENATAAITASATAIRHGAAAILDALGAGDEVADAA